ncbi:MAG: LysR family transcriptional regulator [Devosiaceae bacterium]|nr:LysR family transcriptional regulator [Devosiaceae bacterium]
MNKKKLTNSDISLSSRSFDWNLIKSFLAVLDAGTLSGAAKILGISQPTLSRHMDELERSLKITLFERGRNGAKATKSALAIAEHARKIAQNTKELELSATGKSEDLSGTVRISASQIISNYLLPKIITQLMQQQPQIEIELVSTNKVENLSEREADIAVRMVRPNQPSLIAKKINEVKVGAFAHKSYLELNGEPDIPHNMTGHRFLGYDDNNAIIEGFAQAGIKIDRSFFQFRCDDQVAYLQAIFSGAGIGFIPLFIANQHSNLQQISKYLATPTMPIWLVTHKEVKTNLSIRMVFDFLAQELSKLDLE